MANRIRILSAHSGVTYQKKVEKWESDSDSDVSDDEKDLMI